MGMIGRLPEGHYADCANGYRIHYLDEGQGEVVVFLHGSGPGASGYSNFKGNYPALVESGYRCIIPDHIGYGFSDKPDDVDHPLSFFVECIKQTLDCAGVERCTVVGNSLGGAVALGLALEYPQLVEKLILMAPGGLSELHEYQKMPGMQKVFAVFGSGEPVTAAVMKDLFAASLMHDPSHATDELVAERL
jgi:4,5:9,10-diseco-3-hydroxy-5,9,17-trioxoandrosta-1(10),2-diene-4-oate hydrolase